MARTKEALLVVLDVSDSMRKEAGSGSPLIEQEKEILELIFKQKFREDKKDEISVVLVGTESTENSLNNGRGSAYSNIPCVHEIDNPSLAMLKECIQDDHYEKGVNEANLNEGISVALDILSKRTGKKRYVRKIVVISDFEEEKFNVNDEELIQDLESLSVEVQLIISNEESSSFQELKRYTTSNEWKFLTIHNYIKFLKGPQPPAIGSTNKYSYGIFSIGDQRSVQVQLRVQVLTKTDANGGKLKPLIRMSKSGKDADDNPRYNPVERDRRYQSSAKDTIGIEIEKEDMLSGYYYGKELVMIDEANRQVLGYNPDPCLQVLGFSNKGFVSREYEISPVDCVIAHPNAKHSILGFSCLVEAMKRNDKIAIARYVGRKSANMAKLVLLSPGTESDNPCLYMVQIACSEEIRNFEFRSLEKYSPSEEQVNVMNELLDAFELTHEEYSPENTMNPVYRTYYDEVHKRAINPKHDFAYLSSPPFLPSGKRIDAAAEVFKKLESLFPLERVQPLNKDSANSNDRSVMKMESQSKIVFDEQEDDLSAWIRKQRQTVTSVGQIDPVNDFKTMLGANEENTILKAIKGMKEQIMEFVGPLGGEEYYVKAMECLKALRKGCIETRKSESFNTFLREMKEKLSAGAGSNFWKDEVQKGKVSLISHGEATDSSISEEESQKFLEETLLQKQVLNTYAEEESEASGLSDLE